jgi:hypothetical protein
VAERKGGAPGRAAVLHHRWPHGRAALVGRCGPLGVAPARDSRGSQASLRATPAAPRSRARARPPGRPAQHHPAATRAHQPRHDVDLPAGDRPRGDHRHRPYTPGADDVRQRGASTLSERITSGSAPALPPGHREASVHTQTSEARASRPEQEPARGRRDLSCSSWASTVQAVATIRKARAKIAVGGCQGARRTIHPSE